MKSNQVRGKGLCFQPGAQKSQFKLWRTTFDDSFTVSFAMGVGTGAGEEGGTHAQRGEGGRSAATTTDG